MPRSFFSAPRRSTTARMTKRNRRPGVSHRPLRCESLEPRQLLSAQPGDLLLAITDPRNYGADLFGGSLAISGENIVVGDREAGAVYLFNSETGAQVRTLTGSGYFGHAVAATDSRIVVGAYLQDAAYLFDASGNLLRSLNNPGGSWFGTGVAVSDKWVVVGAPRGAGAAYLYDTSGNFVRAFSDPTPTRDGHEHWFGQGVAILGDEIIVGSPHDDRASANPADESGAAFVFDANTGSPLAMIPNPHSGFSYFANNFATLGNDLFIGASTDGAGIVYRHNGQAPFALEEAISNPYPGTAVNFGASIATLNGYVAIGANLGAGFVEVLDARTGTESLLIRSPSPNGRFGNSLAAGGDKIVVGSVYDTYQNQAGGAVYVFQGSMAENVPPSDLRIAPVPPVIDEGQSITLHGNFTDPDLQDTHTVTIDWGDGSDVTTLRLEAGVVSFDGVSHTYRDDGPSPGNGTPSDGYTITVSVVDKDEPEVPAAGSAEVTVNNVAPVLTSIGSSATAGGGVAEGEPVIVSGTFTDVGTLDLHTARVDWGDGSSSDAQIVEYNGSGSVEASHAYASGGVYTIAVTLKDDDTGTDTKTTLAVVSGGGVRDGTLYVIGTNNDDLVTINQQGNGLLKVHASFFPEANFRTYSAAGIQAIVVLLYGGNDQATVAGSITMPVLLDGGSGNDRLNGGGGPNILLGGIGDDELIGGAAADILIGGLGSDRLVGNGGDDILVAGSATVDPEPAEPGQRFDQALLSLVAEWNQSKSKDAIRSRVHALDDGVEDVLTGSAGQDWFFARSSGSDRDRLLGRGPDESLDELGQDAAQQ